MPRFAILVLLLTASTAAAAPVWVTPKHRAAPPEQMLPGGPLAPVSPADRPHWSTCAMLRIDLDEAGAWRGVLPIDRAGELRLVPISTAGDQVAITLADPITGTSMRLTPGTRDAAAHSTQVPGAGSFTGYSVPIPAASTPTVTVTAPEGTPSVYLACATTSPLGLRSSRLTDRTVVGNPIVFRASVHPDMNAAPIRDLNIHMVVTAHGTDRFTVPMQPDADGVYAAAFTPELPGRHLVQIVARGDAVLRTAEHIVGVAPDDLALGERAEATLQADARTLRIRIDARSLGRAEHARVTAQLWGRDEHGAAVPVCWIGGMTVPHTQPDGTTDLPLDLDARWVTRAGPLAAFELRHIEVRCPRTLALLAGADCIPLTIDADLTQLEAPARIDDRMRTAQRSDDLAFPVEIPSTSAQRVVGGHNLLLVHGYCAGGNPWPLSDFSGAIEIFSDPEANRSHDEFALLIKALADTTKSSGIVAHSQGGCASLHLFTYYFSALDWADGPRLIQSLGTPYQGTPLAGNLALLGDIFGSGCGGNTDLSVEGAALWLSGIPSDTRARVHYWTTSSQGAWCNFFSGLFLTNPEDGVVEVSRGQLPGATNMGNTVGQCHTTGMANPPQYQDASRNSEMNANAAR